MNWKFLLTLFIGIVGAAAWTPWIIDHFKKPKIYGKQISQTVNRGRFNKKEGIIYFMKLSITVINKDFNIQDFVIHIKYPNEEKLYTGNPFWARSSSWVFNETDTAGNLTEVKKSLSIPSDQFLLFYHIFKSNTPNLCYITFRVDKANLENFEFIEFSFINHKNEKLSFKVIAEDINPDLVLFDDSLWRGI